MGSCVKNNPEMKLFASHIDHLSVKVNDFSIFGYIGYLYGIAADFAILNNFLL